MSDNPLAPRLMKGALVSISLPNPIPSVIAFQYNPDTLTRTLEAQMAGGENADRSEALRIKGAPVETIKLDIEIDASDKLEADDSLAIYPRTEMVIANALLMFAGTIEVIPPEAPFTLLIWGPSRILPVRLTEFSITEEAHDIHLNPIRAKVSLGLRVLSYNDFSQDHPGYNLFLAHQVAKEALSKLGLISNIADVASGLKL
jgi:hypothetical protein